MSERSSRELRKVAKETAATAFPAVRDALEASRAALQNEQLTRQRVEYLEAVVGRSFRGRLTWLILGR